MRLHEFAQAAGLILEVTATAYPDQKYRVAWTAKFAHAELLGDGVLTSIYGRGQNPRAAVMDYIRQIGGKNMVVHAYGAERKQFCVPKDTKP